MARRKGAPAKKRKEKKKRIGGRSVSLSVMKKGLWHAVRHSGNRCGKMLCFVGKQRSQFEKSTGTSSGKHRNSPKVTTVRPPEAEVPDVVEDVVAAGEGALDRNSPKDALGPKMESSGRASADKRPLLHRIGGRGGWEMESLGCGVGETTQAINSDLTRQNRCDIGVLLYELMASSSGLGRRCRRRVNANGDVVVVVYRAGAMDRRISSDLMGQ
ncbi:hypothetical protein GW17_00062037 [Ensete ventricosum]|nr:hypothetical protein GW17_00062037 [Ensete ventricosum]